MARHSKQIMEHCKELNGLIGMLAVDAKTPGDNMLMSGVLIAAAIKLYLRANMTYEEINDVFCEAVQHYKEVNDK